LIDENGNTKYLDFDKNDIITWHPYEIVGFQDGYTWDLGDGYIIEAFGLPGHTPGQCAFYDHHNKDIFIGDINGIMGGNPEEKYNEYCTVEALRDGLKKLEPLFSEIKGVFPGHRVLDYSADILKNTLYACEEVLKNPAGYDSVIVQNFGNSTLTSYAKHILEGSALRYHQNDIYMDINKVPKDLKREG
jgi:glyoxylase-like metal-dependent hydrolase (beta-lactamase superfamily II)